MHSLVMNEARHVVCSALGFLPYTIFLHHKITQEITKSVKGSPAPSDMALRFQSKGSQPGTTITHCNMLCLVMNEARNVVCLAFSWIPCPCPAKTILKLQNEYMVHQGHLMWSRVSKAREVNLTSPSHVATCFVWSCMRLEMWCA